MDHAKPWLRYVQARDLDDATHKFDGLEVKNIGNETLGDINGFIFDEATGEPYYVVVDAKGWFKTRHFLVPIGHARLDPERSALSVELTRDQVKQFPGFDLKEFERWTRDDVERFSRDTARVCCVKTSMVVSGPQESWKDAAHYRRPEWWDKNVRTGSMAQSK